VATLPSIILAKYSILASTGQPFAPKTLDWPSYLGSGMLVILVIIEVLNHWCVSTVEKYILQTTLLQVWVLIIYSEEKGSSLASTSTGFLPLVLVLWSFMKHEEG